MIGNSQAQANKSCLSEDRQQLFFDLDTFHPTTKVVELLANFYSDTNALSTYESLQHECVNSDCYPQNVSLVLAFHPTVETVGFPGLHFVKTKSVLSEQADQMLYQVRRFGQKNGRCLQHDPG